MTITILSPGAIIVLILAAALGITILVRLARADDRRQPVPGCPWCDDHVDRCDCTGPCGDPRCQAAQVGEDTADMLEYGDVIEGFERLLKEGHGRD